MTSDPYAFRPPTNGRPLSAHIAAQLNVEQLDGVERVVADPTAPHVVYVVSDRSTWTTIQARASQLAR